MRRYQSRISGPLLDRIDLHVAVPPVPRDLVLNSAGQEDVLQRVDAVARARAAQRSRQDGLNAETRAAELLTVAKLDSRARHLMERAADRYRLSARSTHRVLRTARTIADLCGSASIGPDHAAEALSFRAMDWEGGLGMAAL